MGKSISTDRGIRAAKAANGKPDWFPIGGTPGLRLCVMPSGHKSWSSTIYPPSGKKTHTTLGTYPGLGLADAKDEHVALRLAVKRGERDPVKDRAKREAAMNAYTFSMLADDYMEGHSKVKKRSWEGDEIMLRANVLPTLGHLPADKITRGNILDLINAKAKSHPIAANRARTLISSIFAWGVNEDKVLDNPAKGIKRRADEIKRDRDLSWAEMKTFWFGVEDAPVAVADVLRLALLTGQRISEISGASSQEFDFVRKTWTIPSLRSKNKKAHTVPMAPLALAIFEKAFARSKCQYAFAARGLKVRPISRSAISGAWSLARKKLGLSDIHIHDARRSVGSQLGGGGHEGNGLGYSDFEIGLVLNHTRGITSVYNRGEYLPEKREMLVAWEARLSAILEGRALETNVIVLRKA